MTALTIEIPDDLARGLEEIAFARKKTVQEIALERLRSTITTIGSPSGLLRAMREQAIVSPAAVDELEKVIASGRLPIEEHSCDL